MDNNPYQNKDWSLGITVKWFLKKDRESTVPCDNCNGIGQCSSFGYLGFNEENDLRCKTCRGRGQVPNPDLEPMPAVPEVFRNYMEVYYHRFFETIDRLEKKWKS
jgi:hypothetical protein